MPEEVAKRPGCGSFICRAFAGDTGVSRSGILPFRILCLGFSAFCPGLPDFLTPPDTGAKAFSGRIRISALNPLFFRIL